VDFSIICVNWNSVDWLTDCIPSIYEWTRGIAFEIIIVDNASPKSGVERLAERFPEVVIIKSPVNLGFAGANNLGARHSTGRCILFLNPDTLLIGPALTTMLQHLATLPSAGVMGCRLLNTDRSVQTSSILKFPTVVNAMLRVESLRLRWPRLCGIAALWSQEGGPIEVEAVSGACMLIRREVFELVAGFSTEYFMYSEDVDLCYKVARAGFRNYYVGDATLVHHGGGSGLAERQAAMKAEAELQFCEIHYGRLYTLMFRFTVAANAAARLAMIAAARSLVPGGRRMEAAWARWKATLLAILRWRYSSGPAMT
jgi:N-acetylglucosaminyl-diphospho-decaprenol L-rhamnosyltransferase